MSLKYFSFHSLSEFSTRFTKLGFLLLLPLKISTTSFADYTYVLSLVALLVVIAEPGLSTLFFRDVIADSCHHKTVYSNHLSLKLTALLICFTAIAIVSTIVDPSLLPLFLLLSSISILSDLVSYILIPLRASTAHIRSDSVFRSLILVTPLSLSCVCLIFTSSITLLFWVQLLILAPSLLALFLFLRRSYPELYPPIIPRLTVPSKTILFQLAPQLLIVYVGSLWTNLDILLLKTTVSQNSYIAYSLCSKLILSLSIVPLASYIPTIQVYFPTLSLRRLSLFRFYRFHSSNLCFIVTGYLGFLFIALFAILLFPLSYRNAFSIMPLFSIVTLLYYVSYPVAHVLFLTSSTRALFLVYLSILCIVLASYPYLVLHYGSYGAISAFCLVLVSLYFLSLLVHLFSHNSLRLFGFAIRSSIWPILPAFTFAYILTFFSGLPPLQAYLLYIFFIVLSFLKCHAKSLRRSLALIRPHLHFSY